MTDNEIVDVQREFAADIRQLHADDSATLSLHQEPGSPGTEPTVTLLVRGIPLFQYRRDELIDALYVAGCDALEDLQRAGLPLAVEADPLPGPIQ